MDFFKNVVYYCPKQVDVERLNALAHSQIENGKQINAD